MTYSILDLGPQFWPAGINGAGQIAGTCRPNRGSGAVHICLFDNDTRHELSPLPGKISAVAAINARGWITGRADARDGYKHAFRHADGRLIDLGTLYGGESWGRAINDHGWVVGWSTAPYQVVGTLWSSSGSRAFLHDGDAMRDLGTLGGRFSQARHVNDHGQIVGIANIVSGESHAFLWGGAAMRDLSALPGCAGLAAWAISNTGQVVGTVNGRACLWDGNMLIDLGTPNGRFSIAYGINERGHVIGLQRPPRPHAAYYRAEHLPGFLWRDGVMHDLDAIIPPDTGWALLVPHAINNAGQIVGSGHYHGQRRGFFLTPTGSTAALGERP